MLLSLSAVSFFTPFKKTIIYCPACPQSGRTGTQLPQKHIGVKGKIQKRRSRIGHQTILAKLTLFAYRFDFWLGKKI
jgi:hypothetical protein